jgi:hypothetical protein
MDKTERDIDGENAFVDERGRRSRFERTKRDKKTETNLGTEDGGR